MNALKTSSILILLLASLNCTAQTDSMMRIMKENIKLFSQQGFLSVKGINQNYAFNRNMWDSYILDGDLSPHYFVLDKWSGGLMVDIHPRIHIRIFDQYSGPVRTPTANPGFKLQYIRPKSLTKKPKLGTCVYQFGWYHHSNGQDAHPLAQFANIPGQFQYINNGYHFNVYNGNFSTNYFLLRCDWYSENTNRGGDTIMIRQLFTRKKDNKDSTDSIGSKVVPLMLKAGVKTCWGLNIDVHTKALGIRHDAFDLINHEPELVGYYSFVRPKIEFKKIFFSILASDDEHKRLERSRILLSGGVNLGDISQLSDPGLKSRIWAQGVFSTRIPNSSNASFYLKLAYFGSDPYNIYLEDRLFVINLGLTVGNFLHRGRYA